MRVLIIGASGQLGSDLMHAFAIDDPIGVDHAMVDIEVASALTKMFVQHRPELVINTAAFHNVELCETRPDRALAVNALAVDQLAAQCAAANATLAHISTDYVFDGELDRPYDETDCPNPISAYGISKYAGELLLRRSTQNAYIFRTSGLYGVRSSSTKGYTFIDRILTQAAQGRPLRVVNDVSFSPSYTAHVAAAIRDVTATGRYGTYHVTNAGKCTWYEFAREALQQAGLQADLTVTTQAAFPSLARRPRNSALAHGALAALGLADLPPWPAGITAYLTKKRETAP